MTLIGEQVQHLGASLPLVRMATTEEIAQTIVFLGSDRSSFVTGATIAVDGGGIAI